MPSNVTIIGFKTGGEVPAEGIWARVLSEEVNGAVNYYLNIGKANNGSTHNLAFTPNIPSGAKKVIFEMDLRYNSASKTGDTGVFVKFLNPEYNDPANGYMLCHSMTTYSSYASLYGDKYTAGKWYTLRFEFTIADDGKTSYEVFFNGTSTETGTLDAMVTKLVFETRYGYTHINLDIDNVYIKYE